MVATGKDYNFKKVGNSFQFAEQLMQKIKKKKRRRKLIVVSLNK
jgi:hypothetical protein